MLGTCNEEEILGFLFGELYFDANPTWLPCLRLRSTHTIWAMHEQLAAYDIIGIIGVGLFFFAYDRERFATVGAKCAHEQEMFG
jgi:hypothetical protein